MDHEGLTTTAMPTTIPEGFKKLRENLEITALQESTVSTRQQDVRSVVEAEMAVLDSFLTGSYRRSTMISPLGEADVDIFVVLDPKHYSANGYSALLDTLQRVLKKTYTKSPAISKNGQAVTITFTDFRVDVVPGFNRKGGGYLIPNTELQKWISTDPKKHVDMWTDANKARRGDLVPLIKMIKGWNKSRDLLRSFHLEVLILNIFTGVSITDFPSGVRYFFDKCQAKVRMQIADPAGYSDDVGAHVSTTAQMDRLVNSLSWACTIAREAEAAAAVGNNRLAYDKWRQIFKDYFPAYG